MTGIDYGHAHLPPHAVNFLAAFLRFEFALKEAGFGPENGTAQVEWGRVTQRLGDDFFVRARDEGHANTLIRKPPKKQTTSRHGLGWQQQNSPTTTDELFAAMRRVRNNLVHGGKSGDPEFETDDPQRSERLIREANFIIEQALNVMHDVRAYFEGRY